MHLCGIQNKFCPVACVIFVATGGGIGIPYRSCLPLSLLALMWVFLLGWRLLFANLFSCLFVSPYLYVLLVPCCQLERRGWTVRCKPFFTRPGAGMFQCCLLRYGMISLRSPLGAENAKIIALNLGAVFVFSVCSLLPPCHIVVPLQAFQCRSSSNSVVAKGNLRGLPLLFSTSPCRREEATWFELKYLCVLFLSLC